MTRMAWMTPAAFLDVHPIDTGNPFVAKLLHGRELVKLTREPGH